MAKIKPCPFCGSEPEVVNGRNFVRIKCNKHDPDSDPDSNMIHSISTVWFYKNSEKEAIKAWNKSASK